MSQHLIEPAALADELRAEAPPVVLDATYVLAKPERDGDYRSRSARPEWLAARVPGSLHVDFHDQFVDPGGATHFAHPQPDEIARQLAELGIGEGDRVVVYDRGGSIWAARLWWLLRWIGVDARVLDGGFDAWLAGDLTVESGEPRPPSPVARWSARPRHDSWATLDEVAEPKQGCILICGLPTEQFFGTAPTRYTRRGHIPGSVSVPARELFDDAGHLRRAGELDAIHAAAGVHPSDEVIIYCGGAIAAAANALALLERGFERVRLYDGSIEEWSRDAARPLVSAD